MASGEGAEGFDERAVYVISVAAELAGMHPQTLRIYERKGLLRPARTPGNTRRYSERDIARLRVIQRLTQEYGVNLSGVQMILEMEDQVERLRRRSEKLSADLDRARERMHRELERTGIRGPGTDIVPLSAFRQLRHELARAAAEARGAGRPRRGPIPAGPGGG